MKKTRRIISTIFLIIAAVIFVSTCVFVALGNRTDNIYIFGYKPFIVATGSMEPEFMTNSMVVIEKNTYEQVSVGDVVAFKPAIINGEIAFHRIVGETDNGLITKGDNNPNNDSEVVNESNFVGREVFHTNLTASYISELQKPYGVLRMVILPIVAILLLYVGFRLLGHWTNSKSTKWLVFFGTLLIASIVTFTMYAIWDNQRVNHINDSLSDTISAFTGQIGTGAATTVNGKEVIGIIKIPSINIEYPIIKYEGDASLNLSVTHYSGPELNQPGNVALAGHRSASSNNLFFTRIDQLKEGDVVQITDKDGHVVDYYFESYSVHDPSDSSVLEPTGQNKRELTLISCTSNLEKRYVVKLTAPN